MRNLFICLTLVLMSSGATIVALHLLRPAPAAPAPSPPANPPDRKADVPVAPPPVLKVEVGQEEETNIRVYQQTNRGVVNITTRTLQADDLLFLFPREREGTGSGSVLDKAGHIVTNFHVIEDARQVSVTLFDGSTHEAKVIGSDPNNDVAVVKINADPSKLIPVPWGNSNNLVVGMRVFAIGNPFGLDRTLTTGIVSSLNRSLKTDNNRLVRGVIQTDAAINPGNSGGPLLNRKGEMIGMNTAIISKIGQSSGIGLAVPSNTAHRIVEQLIRNGKVIRADSGIFSATPVEEGLLITRLVPDGPAEKAGLRGPQVVSLGLGPFVYRTLDRSKADLIVKIDGKPVRSLDELLTHVESKRPGDRVTLTILREDRTMDVAVQLEQTRN